MDTADFLPYDKCARRFSGSSGNGSIIACTDGDGEKDRAALSMEVCVISRITTLLTTIAQDEAATGRLGRHFGRLLQAGDVLNLVGQLGAGKTVFIKGVAESFGIASDDVQSPTFTLIREYDGRIPLYHLDLYRLEEPVAELEQLDYEHYFEPRGAVTAIEWGERAGELLPESRFDIHIDYVDEGRRVTVTALEQKAARVDAMRRALNRWE